MAYDIESLKIKMLVKYPFFGSVLSNVKYKEIKSLPTAATDGKVVYYNPEFLGSLSIDEQLFVLAHEVCHIAFNHVPRSEGKNRRIWNIATDGVINQFLIRDGLKMVEGGVDIKEAINYDAETLYEKLLKEQQENQDKNMSGDNSQSQDGSMDDVGHDTHSMWDKELKDSKEQEDSENQDENNKNQNENQNDGSKNQNEKKCKEKQKELEKMGEKDAFNENQKERKEKLEKLKEEILKKAMEAGNSTNSATRKVESVGTSKPILDWRYVLRETINYDVDWSYENAEIEDGVITPKLEERPMSETEIVLDTSSSINHELLRSFLRECKNIIQHSKIKVGCFDTKFYGFSDIKDEEDIEKMDFIGGGGTNFDVAVSAFTKRVDNKIIFTDGWADMPKEAVDVIWIVFGGHKINPPGGRVIYVDEKQLNEMGFYYDEEKVRRK